jgi:hypothetical protein
VSVGDADATPSDTVPDICARRIFAAIAHYLVAEHEGDSTPLAPGPVEIGTAPTSFTVAGGIRAHGPENELTIALAAGYTIDHAIIYGPDDNEVKFRVVVVAADSSRHELRESGYSSGLGRGRIALLFNEQVPVVAAARVQRVEISTTASVRVDHIMWWSGDPAKRIVWP